MLQKTETGWGSGTPLVTAIVHCVTGGSLTWLPGAIAYFLWKDRSRFVGFSALQCAYLGSLNSIMLTLCWLLHWVPVVNVLLYLLTTVLWFGSFALFILGAMAARRGEVFQFPIVGGAARRNTGA